MIKNLIIIGCGGHAKSVASVALACGVHNLVFIDENAKNDQKLFGFPVWSELMNKPLTGWGCLPAYGNNRKRAIEIKRIQSEGYEMVSLASTKANIDSSATVALGSFVAHQAYVGPKTKIGVGCIINTAAIVEHDCLVDDYSHVSVNATLAGNVSVGRNCFIGAGATVVDGIKICSDVTLGAGAVVVRDIKQPGTYVGVPACLVS